MSRLLDRAEKDAATEPSCCVLALGSPHGDDRVPWLVAERLRDLATLRAQVFKVSSPFEIVNHIDPNVDLIVIDVCVTGAPLGTVVRLDESELGQLYSGVRTSHGGSLVESIELAAALGRRPRSCCVLAIEIHPSEAAPGQTDACQIFVDRLWMQLLAELPTLEFPDKTF